MSMSSNQLPRSSTPQACRLRRMPPPPPSDSAGLPRHVPHVPTPTHCVDLNFAAGAASQFHSDAFEHPYGEAGNVKMPYYVVPVLYVPKRVMPDELGTQQSNARAPFNGGAAEGAPPGAANLRQPAQSAPGRMQTKHEAAAAAVAARKAASHSKASTSSGPKASYFYVNKRMRSSSFILDPSLEKVAEENEHDLVHAEDVGVPTRDNEHARAEATLRQNAIMNANDKAIAEIRKRLMETLDLIESYKRSQQRVSKGTQYECPEEEDCTPRPFNHVARLEASLREMRKYLE